MIRFWFEKTWVQYLSLCLLFVASALFVKYGLTLGYTFDWSVLYTVNETYGVHLGKQMLEGLGLTIEISLISSAIALALGITFGLGRLSKFKPVKWFADSYVEFFRNTPLLVQLFFWYFALPMGLSEGARDLLFENNFEFWSATVGLSMYTGAFMAEIIRAGIQSIPKGLLEAAYSSGLTYFQVLRRIILPLAFRSIIPPLGSEFLNNMKNSSLAMVVGVAELCWQAQNVEALTFKGFEATTAATLMYLFLSLTISTILNSVNRSLKIAAKPTLTKRFFGFLVLSSRRFTETARFKIFGLRKSRQAALTISPQQAAFRKLLKTIWKTFVLVCKLSFVAAITFILYKAAMAVYDFNWEIIRNNFRSLLLWRYPNGGENELFSGMGGLAYSILMSVIAISVSFFIGILVGLGRISDNKLFRIPCTLYIEIIRGVPLIMVIFWVYFFIPMVFKTYLDVFWSATIALTVFTGAYLGEIVRSGIENIPAGQFEAAYSTGLSYWQVMRKVILPQALKQMIPAIVGQFISIFKDTSLAYIIGVLELTFVGQAINNRIMIYPFEIYSSVALLYFVCCYSMSIYANKLEKRLSPDQMRLEM
ncbi:MAG: amino acid ABC transporter permease [Desulfovibrio sp.]